MIRNIKEIYQLRPWYHDFKELGIKTNFPSKRKYLFWGPEIRQTRENMDQQVRKESVISKYIKMALKEIHIEKDSETVSILDLFCADGYYGFLAQRESLDSSLTGVDINEKDIFRCKVMSSYLKFGPTKFVHDDVLSYVMRSERHDLILCTGGLYHISDPEKLLRELRKITGKFLIVQSAITVQHNAPDYFESPNPWFGSWGTLFTHARLMAWIKNADFEILDSWVDSRSEPNPLFVGSSYAILR